MKFPNSMTAIPFYRKMVYEHKNDELFYCDVHFSIKKFLKNKLYGIYNNLVGKY